MCNSRASRGSPIRSTEEHRRGQRAILVASNPKLLYSELKSSFPASPPTLSFSALLCLGSLAVTNATRHGH